jgi:Protein of unknown function (DUF2844)
MRVFQFFIAAAACLGTLAHAELGGASNSYPPFAPTIQTYNNYSVIDTEIDHKVIVTEYVNAQKIVFAVSWSGTIRPDMTQLLGKYFFQFQNMQAQSRSLRGGLYKETADMVLYSQSGINQYSGYAYILGQVPAGFNTNTLK